jgi:quercetin dioxygenase-like cupin family protein
MAEKPLINTYKQWQQEEGLPVIRSLYIKSLQQVELGSWKRRGGTGAFINLQGGGDFNDGYVCEIPAGDSLKPERHFFEELIFVLKGRGATSVWTDGGVKQTFEWQEGSLFSIPLNAWHQHFNGEGNEPVRYVSVTNAPLMFNLFHSKEFVFNNPFVFSDRFRGQDGYFSGKGTWLTHNYWDTNFIADLRQFQLRPSLRRGVGVHHAGFELADNIMDGLMSEFPVGTYKKAHRHGPGAYIIILTGRGFSLFWSEGTEKIRLDWQAGSMLVPPAMWFHQHFNTGREPVRFVALKHSGGKYYISDTMFPTEVDISVKEGGHQIEFGDEDPEIHRMFEAELAESGARCGMKGVVPSCTASKD